MRNLILLLALVFFACSVVCPAGVSAAPDKWANLIEESGTVLEEIQKMPDRGVPKDMLKKCVAIAVFPSTVSGGFIVGGKYGQGIVMVKNESSGSWSAPAVFTMVGGSFGWQIGGQASDYVLVFTSKRSVEGLFQSKFKLGADVAVSAGPVGRDAAAATDAQLKGGIFTYSRSRGLFAGLSLEGAVVAPEKDANKALYGKDLSPREILMEDKAPMPQSAANILKVLR
jgi:lipid-binding SYLF domain-containing protein